jgi:TetR/AcrR family transcriptional regulator
MPRGYRSGAPPNAGRTAILQAAERIFADQGLEGARTDAIAKAAGMNKALLYYYFTSKNDLFRAVIEEALRESHHKLMAILSTRGSEREIVLRYAEALFDALSQRPGSYLLFQRFMMTNPKVVERLMRRFVLPRFQKLAGVVRRGVRKGEFRPVDATQTAMSLGALVVFYFSTGPVMKTIARFDPFSPRNLKKRKREMIEFIRHGLFKNAGAHRA